MIDLSLLSAILRFSWFRIFFSIILLLLFSKVLQILIFFTDGNKIHTYFKGRKSHGNRFFSPREFSFWLIDIQSRSDRYEIFHKEWVLEELRNTLEILFWLIFNLLLINSILVDIFYLNQRNIARKCKLQRKQTRKYFDVEKFIFFVQS